MRISELTKHIHQTKNPDLEGRRFIAAVFYMFLPVFRVLIQNLRPIRHPVVHSHVLSESTSTTTVQPTGPAVMRTHISRFSGKFGVVAEPYEGPLQLCSNTGNCSIYHHLIIHGLMALSEA